MHSPSLFVILSDDFKIRKHIGNVRIQNVCKFFCLFFVLNLTIFNGIRKSVPAVYVGHHVVFLFFHANEFHNFFWKCYAASVWNVQFKFHLPFLTITNFPFAFLYPAFFNVIANSLSGMTHLAKTRLRTHISRITAPSSPRKNRARRSAPDSVPSFPGSPNSPVFPNSPNPPQSPFPTLSSQPASTSQIASSKICKPSSISSLLTFSGVANRMPFP